MFEGIYLSEEQQSQLKEAINKACLDNKDGKKTDKGYFTASDLTFWLLMIPETPWTYDKVRTAIHELVQEGKLVEIEQTDQGGRGKRYRPTTQEKLYGRGGA